MRVEDGELVALVLEEEVERVLGFSSKRYGLAASLIAGT